MRFDLWTQILDRYAKGLSSALDLGCGSGVFSFYLARLGLEVTGIDAADGMIALCEKHKKDHGIGNSTFHRKVIPFPSEEFKPVDIIISSSVLEYVEDIGATLRMAYELLRPDGLLIVSLPNAQSLYRKFERLRFRISGKPDYYRFVRNIVSAEEMKLRMASQGFRCEEIAYYGHSNAISILGRTFLPAQYTENLLLGVFRRQAAASS